MKERLFMSWNQPKSWLFLMLAAIIGVLVGVFMAVAGSLLDSKTAGSIIASAGGFIVLISWPACLVIWLKHFTLLLLGRYGRPLAATLLASLLVLVFFIVFPVSASYYFSEVGSKYKFGIIVDDYENVIAEKPRFFALNENTNKYSWNTPIVLPDSEIKIKLEHMVTAVQFDIKLIPEVNSKRFIFTIVECPHDKILSIDIDNQVDGTELQTVSTYLYKRPAEDEKGKYPLGWKTKKISETADLITKGEYDAFVQIFPFPPDNAGPLLGIQKWMFDEAGQTLKIRYLDKDGREREVYYEFELDWYRYMSGWDKILSIT